MNLKDHLDKLGDHFIGLWRFRVKGQPRQWCVTFHYDGHYYDTWAKRTPVAALKDAYRILQQCKRSKTK